ncbi:hypothetical protein B9W73_12600 [Lactococcus lactis]|uniref:hypothetical protein n=1 Tax=Lactococcus lactis TaxID=1358 RepID=UPI000A1DFF76|nr:hypothetical protein [Lactococcus lactis]OSP86020.1 hypothetical protein B9W73_12600 [Lactococcus lactis]
MINVGEVSNLKVPFPSVSSRLARQAHMYICVEKNSNFVFVKSQTFKAPLLTRVSNYIIERSDINRNPFSRETLIDLDKDFQVSRDVEISRASLCYRRKDVCSELFSDIDNKINHPLHKVLETKKLVALNSDYLKFKS